MTTPDLAPPLTIEGTWAEACSEAEYLSSIFTGGMSPFNDGDFIQFLRDVYGTISEDNTSSLLVCWKRIPLFISRGVSDSGFYYMLAFRSQHGVTVGLHVEEDCYQISVSNASMVIMFKNIINLGVVEYTFSPKSVAVYNATFHQFFHRHPTATWSPDSDYNGVLNAVSLIPH